MQRGDRKGAPAAPPLKGNLGDGAAGKEGLGLDDIDEPHGHSDDEGRARVVDFLSSPRFDSVAMLVATDDEALMQACHKVVRI